jgi:hypothetical protein
MGDMRHETGGSAHMEHGNNGNNGNKWNKPHKGILSNGVLSTPYYEEFVSALQYNL